MEYKHKASIFKSPTALTFCRVNLVTHQPADSQSLKCCQNKLQTPLALDAHDAEASLLQINHHTATSQATADLQEPAHPPRNKKKGTS